MNKILLLLLVAVLSFSAQATEASIFKGVSYDVTGTHLKSGKALQSCTVFIFDPNEFGAPIQMKFRFSDEKLNQMKDFFSGSWETFGMGTTIGYNLPLEEGEVTGGVLYENQILSETIRGTDNAYTYHVEVSPDLSIVGEVIMLNKRGKQIASCSF